MGDVGGLNALHTGSRHTKRLTRHIILATTVENELAILARFYICVYSN